MIEISVIKELRVLTGKKDRQIKLALRKSANMDVWAVGILNQLFIRGYWQNSVLCDRPIL